MKQNHRASNQAWPIGHQERRYGRSAQTSPFGVYVHQVTYEPSGIGEARATLTCSGAGGEYTFPLLGTCTPPRPQGPFSVRAGGTTPILFRNVFPAPMPFTFQVGCFVLSHTFTLSLQSSPISTNHQLSTNQHYHQTCLNFTRGRHPNEVHFEDKNLHSDFSVHRWITRCSTWRSRARR